MNNVGGEKLTKDIIKTANIIRKKYNDLRDNTFQYNTQLNEAFKPLRDPLTQLVEHQQQQQHQVKSEPKELSIKSSPVKQKSEIDSTDDEEEYDDAEYPADLDTTISNKDSISEKYLRYIFNSDNVLDKTYGVHTSGNELRMGAMKLEINPNEDLIIGNDLYVGTIGLYELIFMKEPDARIYTDMDLKQYRTILEASNAHRRNYDETLQITGTRSKKYQNIIRPLIQEVHHTGAGLIHLNKNKPDYIYWNDANELIDRLRLLNSSKYAGHTNHDNEIISILEELREAKIIV